MTLPPDEVCQRLRELHGLLGQSNDYLDPLLKMLAENGLSWSDWPEFFFLRGVSSSAQPKKFRRRARALHELIGRGSAPIDQRNARNGLIKQLAEHSLDWIKDLPAALAEEWRDTNPEAANPTSASMSATVEDVSAFDVMMRVVSDRVVLTAIECLVAALWALSTYVYDRFPYAPQFGIVAPASARGKTTFRKVLEATVYSAWVTHHASAAAVYRVLDRNPRTVMMFDDAENVDWSKDSDLRAVVDAAYENGSVDRVDKEGNPYKYRLFCSLLWALRGAVNDVPMAVLSRGLQVVMRKGKPRIRLPVNYLEEPDLVGARGLNEAWATTVQLDLDPEMPEELCRDPRLEDNCRPLISIADSFGVGAEARAALIKFCANLPSSDVGIQALEDARRVWKTRAEHIFTLSNWTAQRPSTSRKELPAPDRIAKRALAAGMIEQNPFWASWRGPRDKGRQHPLTPGEMGALFSRFDIFVSTVWPLKRRPDDKSVDGYYLAQFERAWAEYLDEGHTSTQPNKVIELVPHKKRTRRS
jgi:hypothetical protein